MVGFDSISRLALGIPNLRFSVCPWRVTVSVTVRVTVSVTVSVLVSVTVSVAVSVT